MKVPYNYLDRQFTDAETDAILEKLRALVKTGEFTLGPAVLEFERRLGEKVGVKHVIGTNCGTDALILGLKAFGVGRGDEVITQVNTFYATVGAIVAAGATPRFVDVDACYAMDETKIEAAITPRTKALMPVYWRGFPPNMPAIMEIARQHRLLVIEDACPALGASYDGRSAGAFGDAAAFSLHPLKPLNVWGDGGAVVTNDDRAGAWLRTYRNHGMKNRDEIAFWGVNQRLQAVQAVVATHELDHLDEWVDRRIEIARWLDQELAHIPQITVPPRPPNRRHSFQLYMVRAERRDALLKYLTTHGIEAKVHYPIPLHLQPAAAELGYKVGDFPMAEAQAKEIITLPGHQFLVMNGLPGEDEVEHMVWQIRRFYDNKNGVQGSVLDRFLSDTP